MAITSLNSAEIDDMTIEMNEDLLTCFTPSSAFNPASIEFFVGNSSGKMFYFYKGWISDNKEIIHDAASEGSLTNVVYYKGVICWATINNIRVIHYQRK